VGRNDAKTGKKEAKVSKEGAKTKKNAGGIQGTPRVKKRDQGGAGGGCGKLLEEIH